MRSRLIEAGLVLGYAGLIFFLSSQSSFPIVPKEIWDYDKVLHFIEYGGLSFLIALAVRPADPRRRMGRLAVVAWAISTVYGASDELHQYFVPGRSCDAFDLLADSIGSAMGAGAFTLYRGRKLSREQT